MEEAPKSKKKKPVSEGRLRYERDWAQENVQTLLEYSDWIGSNVSALFLP